ncbi:MAG: hypothetical protein P9X27_00525 [Candidatus Kaelpia aquatica]|nr:hypothetical protein [Candidatus Kaelpia aquatica]
MKNSISAALLVCLTFSILIAGCSKQCSAASGLEAIDTAKTLGTTQEKISYLATAAKALYESEKFQDVVNISQYILTYLDSDSQIARDLLDKAQAKLAEMVQEGVSGLSNKLTGFGK